MTIPGINCSSYNQLGHILDYKLPEKGLPPPIRISPAGVFCTCPECGLNTRYNRFSKELFICTACGKTMNIEQLGSLNVARRLNCNNEQSLKIKIEKTPEGVRLTNKVLGLNYHVRNPRENMDGFIQEIERTVEDFYKNISKNTRNKEFKKKYSLIKKIEQAEDLNGIIQIV
jgi:putative transposase